jgi:hypothetical protein
MKRKHTDDELGGNPLPARRLPSTARNVVVCDVTMVVLAVGLVEAVAVVGCTDGGGCTCIAGGCW